MNEEEFRQRFADDIPMLKAWGDFVVGQIGRAIAEKGVQSEAFLKIPPTYRVKDVESAVAKVFVRKKYDDPFAKLTDRVGVRFVVLLTEDIAMISGIIESEGLWEASKDRDYEEERAKNPLVFDYQSVHYIVRSVTDMEAGGVTVPAGTPCEIQVRTILQHAYSELTHDTIYKPKVVADPDVHRMIARSMALIETTDDIFCSARAKISAGSAQAESISAFLKSRYSEFVGHEAFDPKLNALLLDAYAYAVDAQTPERVGAYLNAHGYLAESIRERAKQTAIFRLPAILLVYYAVFVSRHRARHEWPFTPDELSPIFTDNNFAFA